MFTNLSFWRLSCRLEIVTSRVGQASGPGEAGLEEGKPFMSYKQHSGI